MPTESFPSDSIPGGGGGVTLPVSIPDGGTGATTASGARTSLGAAASGINTDITSLYSSTLKSDYTFGAGLLDARTFHFLTGNVTLPPAATCVGQLYWLMNSASGGAVITITTSDIGIYGPLWAGGIVSIDLGVGESILLQNDGGGWSTFSGVHSHLQMVKSTPSSGTLDVNTLQVLGGNVTLPAANLNYGLGQTYILKNGTASAVTVTSSEGVDITNPDGSVTASITIPAYGQHILNHSLGNGWVSMTGISIQPITAIIDGGGAPISDGEYLDLVVPMACSIKSITLLADVSGSIDIDLLSSTYAGYPTLSSMSTGGTAPSLSSAQKSQMTTFTGWADTAFAAGDVLRIEVTSNAVDITRLTVAISVQRTV